MGSLYAYSQDLNKANFIFKNFEDFFGKFFWEKIAFKIILKGENQKMERSKGDIPRFRRSETNFIGNYSVDR